MLAICTWLWGDKYSPVDVAKLKRGLDKYLKEPFRFLVMTERERDWVPSEGIERHAIKDPELLAFKGCFARLRMFDYGWQQNRKIDDRLICLDLDIILVGSIEHIFARPETFVILGGVNAINPCPFNGSVMMLRPGHHGEVWTSFSMQAAQALPCYEFPDDQGWLAHKLPQAATWPAGRRSGIYGFKKPGWPPNDERLPEKARIVVFPGSRQPKDYMYLDWVKRNWV
jgi:hypothetical protein